MKYRDLLKAAGRKAKPLTIATRNWGKTERELMDQGLCIRCSEKPSAKSSFLCQVCEKENSMEEIRAEIAAARHRILGKAEDDLL